MADDPFGGDDLSGQKYSRAKLVGAEFDGVDLTDARFWAVMKNATFHDTTLEGSDFDDINLSKARFHNITFEGSQISNANMSSVEIDGANLSNMAIRNANLEGMTINGIAVTDLLAAYEASQ